MHLSILLLSDGLLSCLLASAMAVGGVPPQPRAAQSMVVCSPQFAWMDNSKNISPCQVAASVDALCNSGNWVLPALNASVKYNPPSTRDGTATLFTCSWASYNLVSARTACQGFPELIPQWSFYSVGCGVFLSDVAFPSNITLPESVSIPFWAGRIVSLKWFCSSSLLSDDASNKWPREAFNVNNAQLIVSEGHADLNSSPSTPTPKKSSNAGVILACVFIGLLVIALAFVSYMFYQRRKSRQPQELPRAFPNLKVMRLSATQPITSPYRSFFAPPAYSESTTHLNASVYPTESQPPTDTNHSRITNATPGGHEMTNTWALNNPSLLIAMPQAAAQGWNDKKSRVVNHKKRQLRLVS